MQTPGVVLQTLDVLLQTLGLAAVYSWMYLYRPLDVHHILAETAVAIYKKVLAQNKMNQLYQGDMTLSCQKFWDFCESSF